MVINNLVFQWGSGVVFPITFSTVFVVIVCPHTNDSRYPYWQDFGYDINISGYSCRYPGLRRTSGRKWIH